MENLPTTTYQRYQFLLEKAAQGARSAGHCRSPNILAISKGQPMEKIFQLCKHGINHFGESYLQELEEKSQALELSQTRWVFIGSLQSRKILKIVEICSEIQSVASLKQAKLIQQACEKLAKTSFPIYVNVNAGREPQKTGVLPENLAELVEKIDSLSRLQLQGIMAIPPKNFSDHEFSQLEVPKLYLDLRQIANKTGKGKLSLGMSSDFALAVKAGTDILRIGTDIFGPRER